MRALVALTVAVPLGAGALLGVFGLWLGRRACDAVALAAALATLVLCLIVLVRVGTGIEVLWFGGWRPRDGMPVGIDFAVDAFGAGLAAFVSLVMVLALVYTWRAVEADQPHFQVLLLVFLASMIGFVESGDLFNVFVFFELMSVVAFALVGYLSERRSVLQGALNLGVVNTVGAFLFLTGIALVYAEAQTLNLAAIGEALTGRPPGPAVLVGLGLIVVGFLVKAGVVPFHFWLADAYAVVPATVGLMLAAAMSEMGLFGIGRVWFAAFAGPLGEQADSLRTLLLVLGALTAMWGAAMALAEDHLKRMLAFLTVSSVGTFLCGLALLNAPGVGGAALYVVADGFAKAALFACAGIVEHRRATTSIGRLHGAGRALPATGALWLAGGLVVAVLPLTGAFMAKAMIDGAALQAGYALLPALLMVVAALNGAAVLSAGGRVFLGWGDRRAGEAPGEATEPDQRGSGTPATMWVPAALLLALAVAPGLWFGTADRIAAAAARFVDGAGYAGAVLRSSPPGGISAASPAPKGFDYAYAAGSTALALAVAAAGLWGGRLPRAATAARLAGRALRPLAALHSGDVRDYLAWLTVGAGAVALVLGGA